MKKWLIVWAFLLMAAPGWAVAHGGIVSALGITTDNGTVEWTGSANMKAAPQIASPTSTGFVAGDRIVMVVYNDDGNGVTEANGRNWTLDYDAGTGVDGDTYLSFTETVSFASDTINGRPVPLTALLPNWIARLWALVWGDWFGIARS